MHTPRWRFMRGSPEPSTPPKTDTSGCAGRRRWSAATGGGLHAPRWRFVRGSSKAPTSPSNPETDTSGCAGRRRWSAATGGGSHTPRWRFVRGSSCSSFDVQHKTHPANRASRRAAHTVAPKITRAPNNVVTIGTSENKNQPHSDAQIKSKNRSDCKADTSTAWKARVMK